MEAGLVKDAREHVNDAVRILKDETDEDLRDALCHLCAASASLIYWESRHLMADIKSS